MRKYVVIATSILLLTFGLPATSQAVIGGFVIAIIDNGLGLMGFNAGINLLITGGVLLLAASADTISRKRGNVVVR